MDHRQSADLDRHITGNYGEDQQEVSAEPPGLNDEREAERVAILAQADECSAAAAREGFMPGGFAAARSELDRLVRAALATPVAAQPESIQAAARRLLDEDATDIYAGDVRLVAEAVLAAHVAEPPIVGWWNGLHTTTDTQAGEDVGASYSEHEDTWHDIPLHAGVNPCNKVAPTDLPREQS